MGKRTPLIIVAVLIVVILLAVYSWPFGDAEGPDGNDRAVPIWYDDISCTVNDVIVLGSGDEQPFEADLPPFLGKHYIALNLTFSGGPPVNITKRVYWTLYDDAGSAYRYVSFENNPMPYGCPRKDAPVTFWLPFEIPDGASPTKIVYNNEADWFVIDL